MIETGIKSWSGLAQHLAGKAQAIAEARIEDQLRARREDPARWRDARLLWPSFTRGD